MIFHNYYLFISDEKGLVKSNVLPLIKVSNNGGLDIEFMLSIKSNSQTCLLVMSDIVELCKKETQIDLGTSLESVIFDVFGELLNGHRPHDYKRSLTMTPDTANFIRCNSIMANIGEDIYHKNVRYLFSRVKGSMYLRCITFLDVVLCPYARETNKIEILDNIGARVERETLEQYETGLTPFFVEPVHRISPEQWDSVSNISQTQRTNPDDWSTFTATRLMTDNALNKMLVNVITDHFRVDGWSSYYIFDASVSSFLELTDTLQGHEGKKLREKIQTVYNEYMKDIATFETSEGRDSHLFDKDFLFFPYNHNNSHWVLYMLYRPFDATVTAPLVYIFDSLATCNVITPATYTNTANKLLFYTNAVLGNHARMHQNAKINTSRISMLVPCPRQPISSNACGFYVCEFVRLMLETRETSMPAIIEGSTRSRKRDHTGDQEPEFQCFKESFLDIGTDEIYRRCNALFLDAEKK